MKEGGENKRDGGTDDSLTYISLFAIYYTPQSHELAHRTLPEKRRRFCLGKTFLFFLPEENS